jgi:hypothetical protein
MAVGLAVTAATLLAMGPHGAAAGRARGHPDVLARSNATETPVRARRAVELVTAPVRIADAATARLLRTGDRVDVIAADSGGDARVVARGARVTDVPGGGEGVDGGGALVVLSLPRSTAARVAGAGATSRLAVTLC